MVCAVCISIFLLIQLATQSFHMNVKSVLHLAVSKCLKSRVTRVYGLKIYHHDRLALVRNAIILIHINTQACRMCQNRIITSMR